MSDLKTHADCGFAAYCDACKKFIRIDGNREETYRAAYEHARTGHAVFVCSGNLITPRAG